MEIPLYSQVYIHKSIQCFVFYSQIEYCRSYLRIFTQLTCNLKLQQLVYHSTEQNGTAPNLYKIKVKQIESIIVTKWR